MKVEDIINQIYAQTKIIGQCGAMTGTEDFAAICRLFKSAIGVEYCIEHHFPNMATLRMFKPYNPEQYGIYIDAGVITLKNPRQVLLCGRTSATINCDSLEHRHEVILMHGAKAVVNASKWAVCSVTVEQGCSVIKNTSDNAIIL